MTRLGNNIRGLRKAYGETQEELGFALGVEKNTISSYETGRTEPGKDMLSMIASYYFVSVEELLLSDLSSMEKINLKKDNVYFFWDNINKIFPLIWTERAMQNEHFKRATEKHRLFFEVAMKKNDWDIDNFLGCFDEYMEAYNDDVVKEESAANIIGLCYFVIFIFKVTPKMVKEKPAFMTKLVLLDSTIGNALENLDSDFEKDAADIVDSFNDLEMKMLLKEMMVLVKKSRILWEVADYYLAMEYVLGIVDNDLEFEFNRRIGQEMLEAFASVGNRYARRFISLNI